MIAERKPFLTWLIVIIALGCALRFYHLVEIPFNYDELSALQRTHFSTLYEVLRQGVAVDGHPAGVQVFLFYWTKLVGDAEWLVKLPFILLGILCIPLIYSIGARWFNKQAAIIAACLIACLQYTVMFSQTARPYIPGVFLVLLLVFIWNELIVRVTYRRLLVFALVLAMCAYDHYFSLLTAACVAATGLLVIDRRDIPKYIGSIVLAFALFVPHLPLFFAQLKLGGLQWIAPPTPAFFLHYVYYVFNFSTYVVAALLLLVGQGIYLSVKRGLAVQNKYRIIALLWFIVPAVVGYVYSVCRAPVLHELVLMFSFPFLVLFICSFIQLPYGRMRDLQIGTLLVILVSSLIWERNYYSLFYHRDPEVFAQYISGYEQKFGPGEISAVVNTNPVYLDHYKAKYKTGWTYQTFESIGDNVAWRTWLSSNKNKYLILCNPQVEYGRQYLAIAKEYFPCVDSVYSGFATDVYILKREGTGCKQPAVPLFRSGLVDSLGIPLTKGGGQANGQKGYETCDTTSEGQTLFLSPYVTLGLNEKVRLDVSVDVFSDSTGATGSLNLDFINTDGGVQERKSDIQSFAGNDTGWHTVYVSARLYHINLLHIEKLRVGLTAGPQKCLQFRNFRVEAVADNPVLYSLIKK